MLLDLIDISIHALVKRATTVPNGRCTSPVISIHALVKRATTFYIRFKRIYPYFNPRPREEGDKCGRRSFRLEVYFNPRPREEGDAGLVLMMIGHHISIHALVKRATHAPRVPEVPAGISIHALAKRATTIFGRTIRFA